MVIRYSMTLLVAALIAWSALAGADEAVTLSGPLTQGSLVYGQVEPGSQVWLNERPVRVTADGHFVIGFGRDAALEQALKVVSPAGTQSSRALSLTRRDYRVQRVDGVPQRTVTPSPLKAGRIRIEAVEVRRARKADSDRQDFLGPFIWPASGPITGVYGSQRVYNGKPRSPHFGVDVAAPEGAPVLAPAAGTVTLAEPDLFFSGGTVIIDHGYGVSSTFLHMSRLSVRLGQPVEQGEKIGEVGRTGRATGPHLDWRMNWYDVRVDPVSVAPPLVDGHTPPATALSQRDEDDAEQRDGTKVDP